MLGPSLITDTHRWWAQFLHLNDRKKNLEILKYMKTAWSSDQSYWVFIPLYRKKSFVLSAPLWKKGSGFLNSTFKGGDFRHMATYKFLRSQELTPHPDLLVKKYSSKNRLICNFLWGGENYCKKCIWMMVLVCGVLFFFSKIKRW